MRLRLSMAPGCLVLTLAAVCTFAPTANSMVGDYLSYFNIPAEAGRSSTTIQKKLLAYINGATDGSEVRGHITRISNGDIADALIAAHKRGVTVYLVQDGGAVKDPGASLEGDRLEEYFGTRHKYCYEDRGESGPSVFDLTSCVSSVQGTINTPTTHHIKNWYFSNTVVNNRTRTYSTWVTSYNLTKTSDKQFNDVFIVNDNEDLYSAYVRSFASFYNQDRSDDFFNVEGRGHHVIASANTEISYSPQKAGDYVATALSRIGYQQGCKLKVANLSISSYRRSVLKQLVRVSELGCQVQVAYSGANAAAVSRLQAAGIALRVAKGTRIHSKMMLYRGRYDGTPGRTIVWGGSHNWTKGSLRVRDEVFVAISRLGIYKRYRDYFEQIWLRCSVP